MFERFEITPLAHKMELVKIYPTKAEEWLCPICQRRFLLYWPPSYAKEVLFEGNTAVSHYGGKDSTAISNTKIISDDNYRDAA